MTDKDRYVDETLKKQIQDAYGASDEQLKARMDRIEKTLTDDEFAGAEDRIMAKLMARIGAPEQKEETVEVETVVSEVDEAAVDTDLKTDENSSEAAEETSATVVAEEEKVVRFGRKKVLLVAALVATFIGALGVTAIGKKSYFFREREKEIGVVFNSGKNIAEASNLEEAYADIKNVFRRDIFTLNYLPDNTTFDSLKYDGTKATIELKHNGNYIYFVQWVGDEESSINMGSDRDQEYDVDNRWLKTKIKYNINELDGDIYEFEAKVEKEGIVAWVFGKTHYDEIEKIIKNITFY